MSLSAVQQKFVAKCESKCQGGTTVARQLRKMFQQVDLDNDGLVNIREWAAVVEATNGAISQDEASRSSSSGTLPATRATPTAPSPSPRPSRL